MSGSTVAAVTKEETMAHITRIVLLLVACACMAGTALAQKYPVKTVRIVVPQLPGDPCDIFARLLGHWMGERLGQQFVVDNRPGASGTIGLALAAQAPADGYTFACGQGGNMSVIPHTMKNVPYHALKDFAPVALIATNYLALVVHPSTPFKNVGEFIKYLKANPGKVSFASNGEGAFVHMATELFRSSVGGFEYLHVPLRGVPQMGQEIMAGRVDAGISSFTGMYPFIQSGRVRLLGICLSDLIKDPQQLLLIEEERKRKALLSAMDSVNEKYGDFQLTWGSYIMQKKGVEVRYPLPGGRQASSM